MRNFIKLIINIETIDETYITKKSILATRSMMLPNFNDIRYFLEVSQTLNISRASERLGITQPSLSLAIQRLETALGTKLLLRTKGGVQLTKQGTKFSIHGRSLIQNWENIRADALNSQNEVSGHYSIGCHPSVALYTLPHFLPKLLTEYPHLEISLKHDLSRKITEDVISFKLDFGIVVNPTKHPDLVIQKLLSDEVSFWTAEKPSSCQDIESGNAILIADNELIQSQSLLKKARKSGLNFSRHLATSNLEVITSLVNAKVGVGILPERVATKNKSYRIKRVDTPLVFKDSICLVYRADTQKSEASKQIISAIKVLK